MRAQRFFVGECFEAHAPGKFTAGRPSWILRRRRWERGRRGRTGLRTLGGVQHHPIFATDCEGTNSSLTCAVVNGDFSVLQETSQLLFLVQAVGQPVASLFAGNQQRVLRFYPCEISLYQGGNRLLAAV